MATKYPPPQFIDCGSEYPEYRRKLERWCRITNVDKKKQAEVILSRLEGHPSGIESKIDTALGTSIVDTEDGMDKVIKYLDSIYGVDDMTDALTKYKKFTSLRKKTDQSVSEFIAEYERTHIKAKESGCEFSDTVLAFNLLEACRLSDTDEKFILTGIDFKSGKEKKDLFEQAKNSLRKFQSRDKLFADENDSKMVFKKEEAMSAETKEALVARGWTPPTGSKKKGTTEKRMLSTLLKEVGKK